MRNSQNLLFMHVKNVKWSQIKEIRLPVNLFVFVSMHNVDSCYVQLSQWLICNTDCGAKGYRLDSESDKDFYMFCAVVVNFVVNADVVAFLLVETLPIAMLFYLVYIALCDHVY